MNINQKIRILRLACIIIVSGLSVIQYYLIQNTYKLAKEKYYDDLDDVAQKIRNYPEMDSIMANESRIWIKIASTYLNDSSDTQRLLQIYKGLFDSLNCAYLPTLQTKITADLALFGANQKFRCEKIILGNKQIQQFELLPTKECVFNIIGTNFQTKEALKTSNTRCTSTNSNEKPRNKQSYFIDLQYCQYVETSAFEWYVWKRKWGIFVIALSLILAVIVLFFLIFRSLLKQKKIAELQTDFTNNIAHELKTPLASLGLIVKTLRKKEIYENPEKRETILQSLQRQNDRIQYIVDNLLESSMMEEEEVKQTEVEIQSFLMDYFQDFHPQKHPFFLEIAPQAQVVMTNTDKLGNILNNLLDNAIKYSQETAEIRVKTYIKNTFYCIEIEDNGIGIAQNEKNNIFDKFYRVSEGDRHLVKGLGLGLYLCKSYAMQLGGDITYKSMLGKGSTFLISLPI